MDKIDLIIKVKDKRIKADEDKFDYGEWYEENKEKISERKRKRYEENDEYREEVKAKARTRYWKKKEEKVNSLPNLIELGEGIEATVELENKKITKTRLYSTHDIAESIGKSEQTVRLWMHKGYIPDNFIRLGKLRYISKEQAVKVEKIKELLLVPYENIEDWIYLKKLSAILEKTPELSR